MKVLKNISFGLMHGFLLIGSILAVELFGIFGLAKPVAEAMKSADINPWVMIITATACMVIPIFLFAWKVLMPYITWLEPELRRRERENTQWFRARRAARNAG